MLEANAIAPSFEDSLLRRVVGVLVVVVVAQRLVVLVVDPLDAHALHLLGDGLISRELRPVVDAEHRRDRLRLRLALPLEEPLRQARADPVEAGEVRDVLRRRVNK